LPPNGQNGHAAANKSVDAAKPTQTPDSAGDHGAKLSTAASPADHESARGAEKQRLAQTAAKDLPGIELHQDGLTIDYAQGDKSGKPGPIQQIKDGDGTWVSTDGIHFSQPGNKNTRTLSRDQDGHLIFVDQNMIAKESQRINQDLKELHQAVAGRGQSQCERDLRNAVADKSPSELKALDYAYYNQYKTSLYDCLVKDSKLTEATREALGLYWKGATQRSDADVLKLADTALSYRNINLFEEAMRDATPAARQKFIADDGGQKVYTAFTEAQLNDKTGQVMSTKETEDLARACDYMYYGKLSVATQVRDNKGKEGAIETAINAMTEAERKTYVLGKTIAATGIAPKGMSEVDQKTAKDLYQNTSTAFNRAGNHTEAALWDGMIVSPDSGTMAKLASHRGRLYNDSTAAIAGDVGSINSHDLALLRDKETGPAYRTEIEGVLKSYLRQPDAKQVMDIVDKKAQADTAAHAEEAGRRPVLDSMLDSVHYFRSNDQGLMVKSLVNMTSSEQASYKSDAKFRQQLDQAVDKHMSGPAKDAAHYILANTLANTQAEIQAGTTGKDGKVEKPASREDIVVKLYEHAVNGSDSDRKDAVRDLQTALNNDSSLTDRINNPKTDQDRTFATEFHKAADAALHFDQFAGKGVINLGSHPYLDPMLATGHITTALAIHLSTDQNRKVGTEKFVSDMQNISPAEKKRLLNDNTFSALALSQVSDQQKTIALNTLKQGKVNAEDQLQAAMLDGNSQGIMDTLKSIKLADLPGVEKSFADKKYGASMEDQVTKELSGAQKAQAIKLFRQIHEGVPEQEIDTQIDASHARSGIGSQITESLGYGTGPQLDDAVNRAVHSKVDATLAGRHLTDAQLQKKVDENYANLDNFLKDKQSAADTVTNLTTVAGTVGLTVATGGATLPMLVSATAFGAGCRVASQKLMMGENYDATVKQLSKDATLGGLEGSAMALTPELLMGTGTATADLASAEVLEGAAAQSLSIEGQQVLKTGMRSLVQDALKSGADTVAQKDLEVLAVKAGNANLAQDMKASLPKAYKQEYDKLAGDGLRQVKANAKVGAIGGSVSGAGNEAMHGDPGDSAGAKTAKIIKAGIVGGMQGAAVGGLAGTIAHGLKGQVKPGELPKARAGEVVSENQTPEILPESTASEAAIASPPSTVVQAGAAPGSSIERSATTGQVVSTTNAKGVKAEYTWGEQDGKQILSKVKYDGVEEALDAAGDWKQTQKRIIDGYEEEGEISPGTMTLDNDGNLIRTHAGDPITKQITYLADGGSQSELQSGGTILAQHDGLPLKVTDAKGNTITYDWNMAGAKPDLQGAQLVTKDGTGTTQLTKSAAGWQAVTSGKSMLPANAKVAGVTVDGGGTELKITLDTKASESTDQSVSFFSDGTVVQVPRSNGALEAAQSATSKLLKEGQVEIEAPKVEGGLLKTVRYGTVQDSQGNELRVFVRPLNDPRDATALFRIRQTQIARDLHAVDGDSGASPNIVLRDVMLDGKLTTVALQPDQGENFLSQLRRWTAEGKGIEVEKATSSEIMAQVSNKDMADFVKSHPQVYKGVGTAYARRIADGGMDFQGSNWTIEESIGGKPVSPEQPIHMTDIDSKRSYSTDQTTTFGRGMDWGDQAALAREFEGLRLFKVSPQLQIDMEERLAREESTAGRQTMAQAGLTEDQITARIARTKSLVENGFPMAPGTPMAPPMEAFDLPEGYDERLDLLEKQFLAAGKKIQLDDALKHNDTLPNH
jgi:hypothetical protein